MTTAEGSAAWSSPTLLRSGVRMRNVERFKGWLPWLCGAALAIGVMVAPMPARAQAATEPAAATPAAATPAPTADPVGAYQTSPTALSVPNYKKLDEKASMKDVAAQLDNVAQSASRS